MKHALGLLLSISLFAPSAWAECNCAKSDSAQSKPTAKKSTIGENLDKTLDDTQAFAIRTSKSIGDGLKTAFEDLKAGLNQKQ